MKWARVPRLCWEPIVQGAWPASRFLIASACRWVRRPLLTSSASASPIAFWLAALRSAWLTLRSDAKWATKSVHSAEGLAAEGPVNAAELAPAVWGEEVEKGRLKPAAEAVTRTAAPE